MPNPPKQLVIALGGNAISLPGEEGNIKQQFTHSARTAERLADVIERGWQPIITHGNGPQVGNVLRRVEIASDELYTIPLEVCVADTQAGMGYMISQCLSNALTRRRLKRNITTIVTTVAVDRDDPAFGEPTKPIGPHLNQAQADTHRANDGWDVKRVSVAGHEGGAVYRRIVPSPQPREILELPAIRDLVDANHIVVCGGGGGIPVIRDANGSYQGAAAVVDKDRTSALLASALDVATLVILTAVEHVFLNYGHPDEQPLPQLTAEEARRYLAAGQFTDGSMRPKIESAVEFVTRSTHSDAKAIIARIDQLPEALEGKSGTKIRR